MTKLILVERLKKFVVGASTIMIFTAVIDIRRVESYGSSHFHPNLTFADKAGTYPGSGKHIRLLRKAVKSFILEVKKVFWTETSFLGRML